MGFDRDVRRDAPQRVRLECERMHAVGRVTHGPWRRRDVCERPERFAEVSDRRRRSAQPPPSPRSPQPATRSIDGTDPPGVPRRREHAAEEVPAERRGAAGVLALSQCRPWSGPVGSPARQSAPFSAVSAATSRSIPRPPAPSPRRPGRASSWRPRSTRRTASPRGGGSADATTVSFSSLSGGAGARPRPAAMAHDVGLGQRLGTGLARPRDSARSGRRRPGLGSGGLGLGLGCTTESDMGVGCILGSVTSVLGGLGRCLERSDSVVDELLPSLNGVVSDVTGTLSDLGALLPIGSLPTAGLPTAVLEELGLGSLLGSATGSGGLASLSSLGGSARSVGLDRDRAVRTPCPARRPARPGPERDPRRRGGAGGLDDGPSLSSGRRVVLGPVHTTAPSGSVGLVVRFDRSVDDDHIHVDDHDHHQALGQWFEWHDGHRAAARAAAAEHAAGLGGWRLGRREPRAARARASP